MKRLNRQFILGASLLALSLFFYLLHYLIFKDSHHIFVFLIEDIAFVFIEVLLVTLIIHQILEVREKKARLEKLNMVIGVFFSEVGMKLLKILAECDPEIDKIHRELEVGKESVSHKFDHICECLNGHDYLIETAKPNWNTLKIFLVAKRNFLLRLLENPNLHEHEDFTELLWAVFHLAEELEAREDFHELLNADQKHLVGDVKRVYGHLAIQWLNYMAHLKSNYPYLFSLSLRTNPFDQNASPTVTDPK